MIGGDRRAEVVWLATGRGLGELWRTDRVVGGLDFGGADGGLFPGPNGLRLWVLVIPPDGAESVSVPLHASATTDFGFVLAGTVVLEMEDGSTAVLGPGDAFVQAGTPHRWRNTTAEQAVIGVVVVGAQARLESERSAHVPGND